MSSTSSWLRNKTNYVAYKRTNVKFYRNSSSIVAGYDEDPVGSVYGAPEDTMLMELRGYNQDTEYNYRVFYDDLRIEIQLPSCVINGKTYYMEFEKLAPYDSSAALQYKTTIVEDKENGKLTIFYDNIYRTGYYPIGRVFLKFPQIAGLDKGKYTFTGVMRWYNGDTEITHQKYYFKSVEYDISSIPAGHNYNGQGDPMGL